METKFDPKTKVKQGDLGSAADGKQPNQQPTNINFDKDAPAKGRGTLQGFDAGTSRSDLP